MKIIERVKEWREYRRQMRAMELLDRCMKRLEFYMTLDKDEIECYHRMCAGAFAISERKVANYKAKYHRKG